MKSIKNCIMFNGGKPEIGKIIYTDVPKELRKKVSGFVRVVSIESTAKGFLHNLAWLDKKRDDLCIIKVLVTI